MDLKELECILEAILFAAGDSVHKNKLCSVMGIDEDILKEIADRLAERYDNGARGLKLLKLEDKYQLCSRPEYSVYVRSALEAAKSGVLSQSALEVMAIVAYRQPVTKTYVEQVRGVDSTYTVSSLIDKNMIEPCGKLDVPGRPILYKTTENFLRTFGLSSLKQLPEIKEFAFGESDNQLSLDLIPEMEAMEAQA